MVYKLILFYYMLFTISLILFVSVSLLVTWNDMCSHDTVVRALMDRAENVCSDPDILAKEMEHLNKVLRYNNYPQWIINQPGKLDKQDPLIHPETGNEIKK